MITRRHIKGDAPSSAVYSDCERYRYALTRVWDEGGARVAFILLNPSTATEVQNDPTIERCERRARTLGFGAMRVVNIFAWRDTDPMAMRAAGDPVGADNDAAIAEACAWASRTGADRIVAGWGAHGAHLDRGAEAEAGLRAGGWPVFHLGRTRDGQPRHPLYIAYSQQPERWF